MDPKWRFSKVSMAMRVPPRWMMTGGTPMDWLDTSHIFWTVGAIPREVTQAMNGVSLGYFSTNLHKLTGIDYVVVMIHIYNI